MRLYPVVLLCITSSPSIEIRRTVFTFFSSSFLSQFDGLSDRIDRPWEPVLKGASSYPVPAFLFGEIEHLVRGLH